MKFIKINFIKIIFVLSLILLLNTYYKSEIYWNGKIFDQYLLYYIISIILLFFSLIYFFIKQKLKVYLTISIISFLFSLYLYEIYITSNLHFLVTIMNYIQKKNMIQNTRLEIARFRKNRK